ncbi:ABC transporter permease [Acidimicrobiia bacterium EGI L10123]|uniref:branched-chain amino acid ABC transporter permease n=1 Tax=Salinilacustrithrix flava TaxID=2957203 RepID=UPI003D7C1B04|nr:ABC transporter permease [Acidimicrobiia bacterium EGI L10123]
MLTDLFAFTIVGIVTGSIYAVAASGLVVTYTTSGVFNFAHGAVGMIMAFLYWQVRFDWGWSTPVSLIFVLLVVAPLFGVLMERALAKNARGGSFVSAMVVTIGMLLLLMGLALNVWPPEGRRVDGFFSPHGFDVGPVFVTWHQAITVLVAAGVAIGLRLLMFRTRTGITMRAVVDNRGLTALTGGRPGRMSLLSWALGSMLAGLAGILLAPVLQLNVEALTLLVVNAYAAAVVGRLRSVPLTFVGAMVLGLLESYAVGYLPSTGSFANIRLAIPTIMLFVVLLALPEVRLRTRSAVEMRMPAMPSPRTSLLGGAALILVATAIATTVAESTLTDLAPALALGLIALSLVPLTGWAGQISLCQMTFAGVGAFAVVQFAADGSPVGLIVAPALAAAVGVLVAMPALRLSGLYLALGTLAFAVLMDRVVFTRRDVFGDFGVERVERLQVAGVSFDGVRAYFVLLAVVFAAVGIGLQALRRGRFGRQLSAMRDSPAALTMLGQDLKTTKMAAFALSSAIAGLGGALLAGLNTTATSSDFTMFQSLPLVLIAVLGGVTAVSGALLGGLVLAGLPVLADNISFLESLTLLGPGIIGLILARRPDGIALVLSDLWSGRGSFAAATAEDEELPEHCEQLGIEVDFEPRHAEVLDRALQVEGV